MGSGIPNGHKVRACGAMGSPAKSWGTVKAKANQRRGNKGKGSKRATTTNPKCVVRGKVSNRTGATTT